MDPKSETGSKEPKAAVKDGRWDIVKELVERDVDLKLEAGSTTLLSAAKNEK